MQCPSVDGGGMAMSTPETDAAGDSRGRLLALITANWSTQALAAAVQLGVAEHLQVEARSCEQLAQACVCPPGTLRRLLRALVTLEVALETAPGCYAAGPLAAQLRRDSADSVAPWAEYCATASWRSWARLTDCVRAECSARELEGRHAGLANLDAEPALAGLFNRAMVALGVAVAQRLALRLPIGDARTVVDVAGGTGHVLLAVLQRHLHLQGVVYDRPHARAWASAALEKAALAKRCEFVAGDVYHSVPAGANLYLLKSVLHDWNDARALAILHRCREAMAPGARLALVERLMPERLLPSADHRTLAHSDLNMLVGPGGRERTFAEYADLLAQAQLQAREPMELVEGYALVMAS
jgi:hypothetical protein